MREAREDATMRLPFSSFSFCLVFIVYGAWYATNTLPTMIQGHAFPNIT